jgi:dihydroxy-acid dehydratase
VNTPLLRSARWFSGEDEVSVIHRVALRSAGRAVEANDQRPVIGIADSSSELNPCNLQLRDQVADVAAGIQAAGGIPVAFPVMSLGEDLMMPSAMLYRNLLSMEVEEYLRAYPIDGVVLLANCDKSVPGALMGAISADVPTVMLTGGPRPVARFRGRQVGSGTDLWKAWEDHRAGTLDDAGWAEFERCLACGPGACNTMGTATTMALLVECLGFALPGSATVPAADPARAELARRTGATAVAAVRADRRPGALLSAAALRNGARVLSACGGSTNAVLHLLAIAGRTGRPWQLDELVEAARTVPVLVDLLPSGRYLAQDLNAAGGLPAVLRQLGDALELDALSATGRCWADELAALPLPVPPAAATDVIRGQDDPVYAAGAFACVRGSLAPGGALIKVSAASPRLLRHRGPAVVFDNYEQMLARLDDPELVVSADSVLVLAGCGPVGVPGMPEWGMIPIPVRLAREGIRDMVRITDARMSGTSFGTCVLHVAPESAVGGPLALVRDGDLIELDVEAGRLDLVVEKDELERRRQHWAPPQSAHLRGWPALYQRHVTQADTGCDLDFLQAPTPAHARFVPAVVGRS